MAWVERVMPKAMKFRHRGRSRTPSTRPAKRSLDNCNQLATSETKLSYADHLKAATDAFVKRGYRRLMLTALMASLGYLAFTRREADLDEASDTPRRAGKRPWSAARDWRRLDGCQKEWIVWRATCCDSRPVAIPIGCNHRLCPLCAASRLERYRAPVREMLTRMEHPAFLTLTIPNTSKLTKATFGEIRGWWKAFQRKEAATLRGGVYAIEVTYNREMRTWHPHLHIIFDSPVPLKGLNPRDFRTWKHRLEFSWLRVTSRSARKVFRANEFDRWRSEMRAASRGSSWNRDYRRVMDLRGVSGQDAVYECIKYITKSNRFLDVPEAVESFLIASQGVRVIQTFGTMYNLDLDREEKPGEGALRCDCGRHEFERMGIYDASSVEMLSDGRWVLRQRHVRRCRGGPTPGRLASDVDGTQGAGIEVVG